MAADTKLADKHCVPCEGGVEPLSREQAEAFEVEGWALDGSATSIERAFEFRNFHHTMGFVNAVAWIAHREDHHPDLQVSYKCCRISYTTHSIGGLSENDFICAAKINALLD